MLDALHLVQVPSRPTMTRAFLSMLLVGASVLVAVPSCKDEGVGDPCVPEQEFNTDFNGFDEKEVNVESKSFQCRTRICLVNHFRGRVSCPYGQTTTGEATYPGQKPCTVPGTSTPITGNPNDTRKQKSVPAQCVDRAADRAVYCSCRCADLDGNTPSDQAFCECPDGFQCEQLVTSIGKGNEGLTGRYCIKKDTQIKPEKPPCSDGDCDPTFKKCQ